MTRWGFFAGHIVPWAASLPGPWAPIAWLTQSLFYVHANMEPATAKRLLKSFLSFIPSGVVDQVCCLCVCVCEDWCNLWLCT